MRCAYCNLAIAFGGVRDGSRRFCNITCAEAAVRAEAEKFYSDGWRKEDYVSERLSSLPGRAPAPPAAFGAAGLILWGIAARLVFVSDIAFRFLAAGCFFLGAAWVAVAAMAWLPKRGRIANAMKAIRKQVTHPNFLRLGALVVAVIAPIPLLETFRSDKLNFGWPVFILLPVVGILSLYLMVIVHEAGHLIAGRLVGIRMTRFVIGSGPGGEWQIGGTTFVFRALPYFGFVTPEANAALFSPWRAAIFFAGGFSVQTAVALWIYWGLQRLWPLPSDLTVYVLLYFGMTFILSTTGSLLFGLVPATLNIEGRFTPNDGMWLRNLWKNGRNMGTTRGDW